MCVYVVFSFIKICDVRCMLYLCGDDNDVYWDWDPGYLGCNWVMRSGILEVYIG